MIVSTGTVVGSLVSPSEVSDVLSGVVIDCSLDAVLSPVVVGVVFVPQPASDKTIDMASIIAQIRIKRDFLISVFSPSSSILHKSVCKFRESVFS